MKMPDPGRLAARFDAMLRFEIGLNNYREVQSRNATPDYANCCASHNFCDANMVMFDAFKQECGREMKLDAVKDVDRFNAAWVIAKADYLTEKPDENN